MRSEHSWSLLDPKPVIAYLENLDEYIVYWNGIAMTHSIALCLATEYMGIYPTPEMREVINDNHRKVYYAGGFETRDWNHIFESTKDIYNYIRRVMAEHLENLLEDRDPKEVLGWFSYDKARIEQQ